MGKFIIFTLPRCRSAWLSHFLSYDGRKVGHDIAIDCKTKEDFFEKFDQLDGTVETGAIDAFEQIVKKYPDLRIVFITRPINEVKTSLLKFGLTPISGQLEDRMEKIKRIAAAGGYKIFEFIDLQSPYICGEIFSYCFQTDFDRNHWDYLSKINIQIDMNERISKLKANHNDLEKLKSSLSKE